MRILVTGGTGFLGQHVVRTLLKQGHQIRMQGRRFDHVTDLIEQGVEPLTCELSNRTGMQDACKDMEIVYHIGALSAPWGKRGEFFSANVDGTAAVLEGCRMYGVRRCIYISSPSVLFDGQDHYLITDDHPYPSHFVSTYSLTKKLGEDLIRQARTLSDLETVVIRPKAIFGPGDQTLLPRLIEAARKGRLPQIGDGRNRVDLTYVENVVHALVLALDAPAANGQTYTITNDEHVPLWDTIRSVLQRLNISTDLRRVSLNTILTAARLMEAQAALTGKEPMLTRYSALILARNQTYDISAARRDLGYRPIVSVAEGIERTVESWQTQNG